MKLIFLIYAAAVCSSTALSQGQTSLWPQRPAALNEARLLAHEARYAEALDLLRPLVSSEGIVGSEVRALYSSINMRQYMNREHPRAFVYEVQSGDHIQRIANKTESTVSLILFLNGMTDAARLRVGQKLVALPLDLHIAIHEQQKELVLWDRDVMLASFPLDAREGEELKQGVSYTVEDILSYRGSTRLSQASEQYQVGDRVIKLNDGVYIAGTQQISDAKTVYRLPQRLINEWALLITTKSTLSVQASKRPGEKPSL